MKAKKIDFLSIHKRVIQEHQLSLMLSGDISRQRQQIGQTIRKVLIDFRSFCFLDTWYTRLSMTDITQFLQSSIYRRSTRQVFENPSSLPFSTSITIKINQFMKSFPNFYNLFFECVVSYFNSPHSDPEYNPCDKSLPFFASSTFPSLFGYGWCVEQSALYAESIIHLLSLEMNRTSSLLSSEFRNSFMREVVRQFMHVVGVQRYLQMALSSNYWRLINDVRLDKTEPNSFEWFEILSGYVRLFEKELLGCISHMPPILLYFFKRVAEIDSSGRNLLLEFVFFDYLLQPALLNPKLFALIPETAPPPSSSCLTSLTRLIRWAVNPNSIPQKFEFIKSEIPIFNKIKMKKIVAKLAEFNGSINGIYAKKLQEISDVKYHLLLLSVNDVLFLTKIVNESIEKITNFPQAEKDRLKNLCNISITLENDDLYDFWFQAFKLPDLPENFPVQANTPHELVLPVIKTHTRNFSSKNTSPKHSNPSPSNHSPTNSSIKDSSTSNTSTNHPSVSVSKKPNDHPTNSSATSSSVSSSNKLLFESLADPENEFRKVILHLINYLQGLKPSKTAPSSLGKFLAYQKNHAIQMASTEWTTRTKAIQAKLIKSGKSSHEILKAVNIMTNIGLNNSAKLLNKSFLHQQCIDELNKLTSETNIMKSQLEPIIHQSLLRLYFHRRKKVKENVINNRTNYMIKQSLWVDFLAPNIKRVIKFSNSLGFEPNNEDYDLRLTKQFHSEICELMTFSDFKAANPNYAEIDKKVDAKYITLLKRFTKEQKSQVVNNLLSSPSCFDTVVHIIRNGIRDGAPLERLEQIKSCAALIKNLYSVEASDEDSSSSKDYGNLFIYILLRAKIPELASLTQYISHFLIFSDDRTKVLTPEEKDDATTFLSAASQIIASVIH
ncbi:hypothetical protein TRFO_06965 [Tritrichomonas foetus]|uniref:VPS9 domain-containing protein n=1 Tax=Tritrichomonas foetus TaxID=1144522 RepID=A0A1J4JUS4_9EUKA|nr:hypothetical protein TRFO_06965 [Tritrichomonas foetus]|eukprot:OHT02903.1 hypothetical protein TRFO_06965 [Tritrichomonas foetus]